MGRRGVIHKGWRQVVRGDRSSVSPEGDAGYPDWMPSDSGSSLSRAADTATPQALASRLRAEWRLKVAVCLGLAVAGAPVSRLSPVTDGAPNSTSGSPAVLVVSLTELKVTFVPTKLPWSIVTACAPPPASRTISAARSCARIRID